MTAETLQVAGVAFPLVDGFEPLPDRSGVSNGSLIVVCSHLPERCGVIAHGFNSQNLADRGLKFSGKTNVSVGGLVCDAIRFRQTQGNLDFSKWAVFYPIEQATKLFIVTCSADFDEIEQIKAVRAVFANLKVSHEADTSGDSSCFEFQASAPFEVGQKLHNQTLLTSGGVFPLRNPQDPLVSLAEVPMRLLPQQFKPYIGKRLESVNIIKETVQIADLSKAVFAIRGVANVNGVRQVLQARYFFLPRWVINAEAFISERDKNRYDEAVNSIFDSIRPAKRATS